MAGLQDGGVYFIVNEKTGTTIDVSGGDGRSVSGWTKGEGENQKFRVQSVGDGKFTLQNLKGQYLSVEGNAENGVAVIGSESPFAFRIEPDNDFGGAHKIFVPDTPFVVDLSDHGNPEPGTAVTLWVSWVAPNQAWRFTTLN